MANENDPAPTPGTPGQAAGGAQPGTGQPPASGGNQTSGGEGGTQQKSEISTEELNNLRRKAGRWDAHLQRDRESRRNSRRSIRDYDADNADPALLDTLKDRDDKIDELTSANVKLEVKDRVRDLLDSDEYKDIASGIRRAIIKNPLGFASMGARTVDDAIADIQDYLDDELDNLASGQPKGQQPAAPSNNGGAANGGGAPARDNDTPPAGGSGPGTPAISPLEGTEGKTGSARSVAVLQNIIGGKKG